MKMNQHNAGDMTKMAARPIYGKNILKILFPGTTWPILMKLCLKYQRPEPFIIVPIMTLGWPWPILRLGQICNLGFTWENVTLMDSLEFIASCDLEFG